MNLELRSITGKGDFEKERLTFRAKSNLDVGDYILIQTSFINKEITTNVQNAFWFSYHAVNKGDLVVLYTRNGSQSSRPLKDGGEVHFFYWSLESAIWEDEELAAVLLHSPEWDGKSTAELSRRIIIKKKP